MKPTRWLGVGQLVFGENSNCLAVAQAFFNTNYVLVASFSMWPDLHIVDLLERMCFFSTTLAVSEK